ncbi:putative T-cell immunomodulatory protein-like protein precursor [Babesia divergens]|uniref:T-cell immunomodulatory protein-like protein n=1 Tax=Babesia divergens TaxID=32595 RepID=A0AAD9LL66_BABDI|nr:putative T-cell immunomodulatory protein-like protein precursor [Babesia divergens]
MSTYGVQWLLRWVILALAISKVGTGYEIKQLSHIFRYKGRITDFGDYDGNGQLSVLTYYFKDDVSTIYVFPVSSTSVEQEPLATLEIPGRVVGAVGVDINMDSALDVLVILKTTTDKYHLMVLYQEKITGRLSMGWDSEKAVNMNAIDEEKLSALNVKRNRVMNRDDYKFTSIYPMVLDINGDGLVDFLCQTEDKKLFVWTNCGTTFLPFLLEDVPACTFEGHFVGHIPSPHSSAFVDIDGDCRADLVLLVEHGKKRYLQIWQADADGHQMKYTRNPEKDIQLPQHHGQVSFADINGDGTIDIAVPYCTEVDTNGNCTSGSNIAITFNKQKPFCSYIWNNPNSDQCRKATELCSRSDFDFGTIHSAPPENIVLPPNMRFDGNMDNPITLSLGDLNNDGYPDLIALAVDGTNAKPVVMVYKNLLPRDSSATEVRTFDNYVQISTEWAGNCQLRVAALDLFEDGITEVGIFASNEDTPNNSAAQFYTIMNVSIGLFMKAMVKGLAEGEKPSSISILSTGHNVHGPTFKITVIDVYGTKSPRCSTIRAQSAYSPLLPPYSMFGLGKTNNYIEEFYLGMPSRSSSYSNMWISIIPNCSVIAVPYRLFYPNEWAVKLSLSPSKEIYKILITTLVCLASLGIIILGFDIKERREDSEQEKGFRQKFIIN